MAVSHPAALLLLLSGYLSLIRGYDICSTYAWDSQALHGYCATVGLAAYRSPACSVFRLCSFSSAAVPALEAQLCSTDRLFITLCADQPDLPECKTFQQQFASDADHGGCVASKAFPVWSTSAAQAFMANACRAGHRMAGCTLCNADSCLTSDPLLAYTAGCTQMPAAGCEPWADFCAAETPSAAPALCLPPPRSSGRRDGGSSTAASAWGAGAGSNGQSPPPPPPADPCIADSTQPSCTSYTYPDSLALANIDKLCGSMPDMPGCAISRACEAGGGRVAAKYCRPFVLLATLCHDMPGMRGCENYKALCKAGSVVRQCAEQPAIPGAPTWSPTHKAVLAACDDHPMAACANCTRSDCPDPLGSLAGICHEMPNMAVCKSFWAFCSAAGPEDVPEWCAEDDKKYLPSMLMYFHQRTQELLLWKEWRPMTQGQYVLSVIAIVAMGVVATGLKTIKGALVLQWNHERALSGMEPERVTSVWRPRSGQMGEILAKSAITGVSLTLDYFNMLIAMTFNVGFFCAVIAGYIVATLLFGHVLENYGAILHQQRRDRAAQNKRPPHMNGGAGLPERTTSDEELEEALLLSIEGEGDCNCVHSA